MTSSGPPVRKMTDTDLDYEPCDGLRSSSSSSSSFWDPPKQSRAAPKEKPLTSKTIMEKNMPNGVAVEFHCSKRKGHSSSERYYVACFESIPTFDSLMRVAQSKINSKKFECRLSTTIVKDAPFVGPKIFPIEDNKTLADLVFLQKLCQPHWSIDVTLIRKKRRFFSSKPAVRNVPPVTPC